MLHIKSENGNVDIFEMDGTEKSIIADIGATAHKTLLTLANQEAKTEEEVFIRYGALARQLVDYIDITVNLVDETGK